MTSTASINPHGISDIVGELVDETGARHELATVLVARGRELRWITDGVPTPMRDVVAALERYEPVRTITARAIAAAPDGISTGTLRGERRRLLTSSIVLNAGLRAAVMASPWSASEIAKRCGRTKRDKKGNISGETSWLKRRIGLLPDGSQDRATHWIHSDVLALIARQGLNMDPRSVEVDVLEDVDYEEHYCPSCTEIVLVGPDGRCPWCETRTGSVLLAA